MINQALISIPHWYVIHTHPKQEDRAEANLRAWNVETFAPKQRQRRYNRYIKGPVYRIKPLFPGYIFARFNIKDQLHKIRFTRGIHNVVSFGNNYIPVDDQIIDIIQSRQGEGNYIVLDEELKYSDEVVVVDGPFKGLTGIFERGVKDADRVMILLKTVNYQSHVMLDRDLLKKL